MKHILLSQFFCLCFWCYLTPQVYAQVPIHIAEINNGNSSSSCNLTSSINTTDLTGITAIELEFWTSEAISNLTSRIELTSSGGPDNGEYAASFANLVDDSKRNQWQTLTIPFDINQVYITVGNTTPDISAINFLRMYISGEPNGTYKVRNIRAINPSAISIYEAEANNSTCDFNDNFNAVDLTNITEVQLELWTSRAISNLTSRLELTCSGGPDNGEYAASFANQVDDSKLNQWQTLTIPFDINQVYQTVGNTPLNISATNFFRMYIDGESSGTYKIRDVRAITGSDNTAPSTPSNLMINNVTANSAQLTWNASSDNVGVTGYDVYRNNVLLASNQSATSYTFNNLSVGTAYDLKVAARDAAGNVSSIASQSITLTQISKNIQAETAYNLSGTSIASNHANANGPNGEFLDYGGDGTFAEWSVSGLPSSGTLTMRYSAVTPRGIRLYVNGVAYASKIVSTTSAWDVWKTVTWSNVAFTPNSNIRLTADGNGPNIDEFTIDGVGLSGSNANGLVQLPIEVLGAEGTTETTQFSLNNISGNGSNYKLQLTINNLSYENKASVKINNEPYVSLNHSTTTMQTQAANRGGMAHGGFNTIRLTIPGTGLKNGNNTISFRFNTSDGISIGYRVIKLNVLDPNDNPILGSQHFEEDDPATWVGPYTSSSKISQGKALWEGSKQLWNHYLPNNRKGFWYSYDIPTSRLMLASCSDCHTKDGRDLELFSYSNKSIIERAKFHKLTEEEGKQIASYIRSLSASKPNVDRVGRPWNPPYQPGPAMANETDMNKWAAGAGLDAVLENDADMLPYLFPNGVTKSQVEAMFDSDAMYDRTTIPLAIQFPDWKHWLPIIHIKDAYSSSYLNSSTRKPLKGINDMRNFLDNYYSSNPSNPPSNLLSKLVEMYDHFRFFQEEGSSDKNHWRSNTGNARNHLINGISHELANTSLARLLSVKNFEFMQEFNLQDKAHHYVPAADQPGVRQWPSKRYSVFEVPPHFTAENDKWFVGQPQETGFYESTNWYNLQFVLNGGNGLVGGTQPTDFNYHVPHIGRAIRSSGIQEPLRYFSAIAQSWQIRTWTGQTGPGEKGYKLKQQGPWAFVGIDQNSDFFYTSHSTPRRPHIIVDQLNDIHPNLDKWVIEALLKQFNKEMAKPLNDLSSWPRTNDNRGASSKLERIGKTNSDIRDISTIIGGLPHHHADKHMYIIPIFKEIMGSDCAALNQYIQWCRDAYPNINWPSNCGSSNRMATVNTTSSLSEETALLYPNPFESSFLLNTDALELGQTYSVQLHTPLGVVVHQQDMQLNGINTSFRVTPDIPSGMYLLTIYNQTGQPVQSSKIVKQ